MGTQRRTPELIYCADGNRQFAGIAVDIGWRYGARLPATVYESVWFADQNWKEPDLARYARAIEEHRPQMATVLDWEHEEQLPKVLTWAEAIAPFVAEIVVIPKIPGRVGDVPEVIGGKPVVLGFSVPTSYGGTTCWVGEFERRPIHLLGGSPQAQMEYARYLNVVSLDGNMTAQQARKGRTWRREKGTKGHWWQLSELGDARTEGTPAECFRRSLIEVKAVWQSK
jgi:hypothetical protein